MLKIGGHGPWQRLRRVNSAIVKFVKSERGQLSQKFKLRCLIKKVKKQTVELLILK